MSINRRSLLLAAGAAATAPLASAQTATPQASPDPDVFARAVDAGLATFRRRAREQAPLVKALTTALASGDRVAAEAAYVASRPPYEEIEVLAACFPDTDKAIDARPYAFEAGETDEGFKGFHRIEALLFRDGDLAAALPFAEELERLVAQLAADLDRRDAFSAKKTVEGCLALATEIGAKKISSEEETWSDRSLLIFRHNLIGIDSQYRPFASELERRDGVVASNVLEAYRAARAAVDALYGADPGGAPYSGVKTLDRRAISSAAYAYRDALAKAAGSLRLD